MNILFITDSLSSFKIEKDTTYAIMAESERRGHVIYVCEPQSLAWTGLTVEADVFQVTLIGDLEDPYRVLWYKPNKTIIRSLTSFDAVLMRKNPPFDIEYVTSTWLLELAERSGARIFNKPKSIRDHSEKLAIAEFPQFITPTLVTRDPARLRKFQSEHGDIIFKPLDGMGGIGVFRVKKDGMNLGSIIEILSQNGLRSIMAQKYIPDIEHGDKRILLIGTKIVPYSLVRIPQGNEVRGNLASGGLGIARPLTKRDREIADTIAPILDACGFLLIGLDVIGEWLTEINVTSPTCFSEITAQTGFNVAGMFLDELERKSA
ncbi:MAG: glutathione synthase [Burkholderia sp.]|nr:glutathione synthase [Burkholderia sp.]